MVLHRISILCLCCLDLSPWGWQRRQHKNLWRRKWLSAPSKNLKVRERHLNRRNYVRPLAKFFLTAQCWSSCATRRTPVRWCCSTGGESGLRSRENLQSLGCATFRSRWRPPTYGKCVFLRNRSLTDPRNSFSARSAICSQNIQSSLRMPYRYSPTSSSHPSSSTASESHPVCCSLGLEPRRLRSSVC